MHIYILYSFISIIAVFVALMAFFARRMLRKLALRMIEAVHMININSYDLAVFTSVTLEQKAKKEELTDEERECWYKARKTIYNFERDYKVRKTHDENISSSTKSTS